MHHFKTVEAQDAVVKATRTIKVLVESINASVKGERLDLLLEKASSLTDELSELVYGEKKESARTDAVTKAALVQLRLLVEKMGILQK